MLLKRKVEKKEDLPKGMEGLYTIKDEVYILNDIEGLKPIEDFEKVNIELKAANKNLATITDKFKSLGEKDPKEILLQLDELDELKLKGGDKTGDNEKLISDAVEIRIQKFKRELKEAQDERDILKDKNGLFLKEKTTALLKSKINDQIFSKETKDFKVYAGVIPDIEIRAERDLEYNESEDAFFTKDAKKLSVSEWYNTQVKDGALWEKGSRGDISEDGKIKNRINKTSENTVEAEVLRVWEED